MSLPPEFHRPLLTLFAKINSISARTLFKQYDADLDNLLQFHEVKQLCLDNGLSPVIGNTSKFNDFLKSFSRRGEGTFGYSDFLKFLNCRWEADAAANAPPRNVTPIQPNHSVAQIFDILLKDTRGLSVEVHFSKLDASGDGVLTQGEMRQGLAELGYELTDQQIDAIFGAFELKNGTLPIKDFSKTVYNPACNPRVGSLTKITYGGGISRIPIGTTQCELPDGERPLVMRTVQSAPTTTITTGAVPDGGEVLRGIKPIVTPNASQILLTDEPPAPSTPKSGRVPPGGLTTVNKPPADLTPRSTEKSRLDFLSFKPEPYHANRVSTPGGRVSLVLSDTVDPSEIPGISESLKVNHPPGGAVNVELFPQKDLQLRSMVKRINPPGGAASDEITPRSSRNFKHGPGGAAQADLLAPQPDSGRDSGRPLGVKRIQPPGGKLTEVDMNLGAIKTTLPPGGNVSVSFAHPHSDLDDLTSTARRRLLQEQVQAQTNAAAGIDLKLLYAISNFVNNNNSKLRETFCKWNKQSQPILTLADFKSGVDSSSLLKGREADVEAIFVKFDSDSDGIISYSEFVRMMNYRAGESN